MKGKAAFVIGAGVGYLLGTRAGRGQFEKIKGWANDAWHDPRVQGYVHDVETSATQFAKEQGSVLRDKAMDAAKSALNRAGTTRPEADDPAPDVQAGYPVVDLKDVRKTT